jgi:hypothetical protein
MSAENRAAEADCSDMSQPKHHADSDEHMGAVEGDRSDSPQPGNANAPALDDEGMPNDATAIAQDVLGANLDETEG